MHQLLGMKTVGKPLNRFLFLHLNTKTKAKAVKPDTKRTRTYEIIKNFKNELILVELCRTQSIYEKSIWNINQ
jgi:hypothetical protein